MKIQQEVKSSSEYDSKLVFDHDSSLGLYTISESNADHSFAVVMTESDAEAFKQFVDEQSRPREYTQQELDF